MFKKISVHQLTLGMHLKEFCGSWMEHPFWRTAFVLTDPKDIEAILASSIKEVWIDCAKGLDVAAGVSAVSVAESESQVEGELKQAAEERPTLTPVSAANEIEHAAKICLRAKQAVISMFEEARMGNLVEVGGAKLLVEEISCSIYRNPWVLISLARIKNVDDYTYMHSVAVCAMMVLLSRQLGLDEAQTQSAGVAGLLHDFGKATMPIDVLQKPGKLTDAEYSIIKRHSKAGHKLLRSGMDLDPMTLDVCLHHHERMDGSGYPDRLKADEISLGARMAAVCDVYDAITSNRHYKSGWDPAASLKKMAAWSGQFDPKVFQAFVKGMGIYPVGSLVRLTSGRLGVVIEQTGKSLTTPSVKVFFSTKSNMRILPQVIDLSSHGTTEKIVAREDPAKWCFPDLNELWSGLPQITW